MTGKLGTAQSKLSQILLGTAGGEDQTLQVVQALAAIRNTVTRTVTARCRIVPGVQIQCLVRARLQHPRSTVDARANIRGYRHRVFDTFTRADSSTTLGTADTGQLWAVETGFAAGVYGISANRPWAVSGAASDGGATLLHGMTEEYIVQSSVRVDPGSRFGLIWRSNGILTPGGQKFYATLFFSGAVSRLVITRQSGVTFTDLYDQPTVPALSADQVVQLKIQAIGNLFTFWIDDIIQTTLTDATHAANTRAGIIIGTNSYSGIDNFGIFDWGATQTGTARCAIRNTVTQTGTARCAIRDVETHTITARTKITTQTLRQCTVKVSILDQVYEESIDDIAVLTAASPTRQTHDDRDEFSVERTQPDPGDAVIWELSTQFNSATFGTVKAKASIRNIPFATVDALAHITGRQRQQCDARARINPRLIKSVTARAKMIGRTVRSINAKANIQAVIEQTCTVRARIRRIQFECDAQARIRVTSGNEKTCSARASMTPQQLQKCTARAAIHQTISNTTTARCRIRVITDAFVRARIVGIITATLEVSYNILGRIDERLAVNYNVSGSSRVYEFTTVQARIRKPVETTLTVTYNVSYNMPEGYVHRPTQRIVARSTRQVYARARIRT